jgi:hypothetical protein
MDSEVMTRPALDCLSEDTVIAIAKRSSKAKFRCIQCVRSSARFNAEGIKNHLRAK